MEVAMICQPPFRGSAAHLRQAVVVEQRDDAVTHLHE